MLSRQRRVPDRSTEEPCADKQGVIGANRTARRKLFQSKAIAIENDLRATLRNFGLFPIWPYCSRRSRISRTRPRSRFILSSRTARLAPGKRLRQRM